MATEVIKKTDAFGHVIVDFTYGIMDAEEGRYIVNPKPVLDPENPSRTDVDISDKIDVQKLITSYHDSCGFEAMMRLVRTGEKSLEDFMDDGKHSGDSTIAPCDPLEASVFAKSAKASAKAVCDAYGIPCEGTADEIAAAIEAAVKAKISSSETKGGDE